MSRKLAVITGTFNPTTNDYIMQLTQEEVEIISGTDIYEWHKANLSRYENVRILRNRLEKAINETLVTKFIIDK